MSATHWDHTMAQDATVAFIPYDTPHPIVQLDIDTKAIFLKNSGLSFIVDTNIMINIETGALSGWFNDI